MFNPQTCPQCGAEVPARSPQGLCPGCLIRGAMKWGLEMGESFTGNPAHEQRVGNEGTTSPLEEERGRWAPVGSLVSAKIRYFGDYEILEEIAHGGMGVVYQARQLSLNRIVALKMILAGRLATPATLERFRNETKAASQLDHPNIVPIYEVGSHDGLPYFSMKFVGGVNLLQEIGGHPLESKTAAVIMIKIARALQYAHQCGVLHLDLKPANILLDPQKEPHVSDFGLAKLVEPQGLFTQTRVISGTPGYMAPEQAAGTNQPLTVGCDVYSLGAIFYEMLTGLPPFGGRNFLETLRRVIEENPARPETVNPRIDRDAQTICLRCLEKKPESRYPSAEALAMDLENWINGKPIAARPCRRTERILKWAKRRPTVATLIATVSSLLLVLIFIGINELSAFRAKLVEDSRFQSEMVAQQLVPSLAYDNEKDAQSILDLLKGNAFIVSATVFMSNGVRFAQYPKDAPYIRPKILGSTEHHFQGPYLVTTTPITSGGKRFGTVLLRMNFQDRLDRIKLYGGLFVAAVMGPVFILYLLIRPSKFQ